MLIDRLKNLHETTLHNELILSRIKDSLMPPMPEPDNAKQSAAMDGDCVESIVDNIMRSANRSNGLAATIQDFIS